MDDGVVVTAEYVGYSPLFPARSSLPQAPLPARLPPRGPLRILPLLACPLPLLPACSLRPLLAFAPLLRSLTQSTNPLKGLKNIGLQAAPLGTKTHILKFSCLGWCGRRLRTLQHARQAPARLGHGSVPVHAFAPCSTRQATSHPGNDRTAQITDACIRYCEDGGSRWMCFCGPSGGVSGMS